MTSIVAAVVSYFSDGPLLSTTIRSLAIAGENADCRTRLVLVDNAEAGADAGRLDLLCSTLRCELAHFTGLTIELLATGSNGGYGAGNNAALANAREDFVLVLNPDVELAPDALANAVATLARQSEGVLVAPRALDRDGRDLHLGHGHPTILALAGRSVGWLQRFEFVRRSMENYELRQFDSDKSHTHIVCASGCFMFMRRETWLATGGFDPAYFLYFEDYDLSTRLRHLGPIIYRPDVRITHLGGDASGKGFRHTRMFMTSAARFFWQHGLRWS